MYYRLPKVLWDYIWSYDVRHKIEFKKCVSELNQYFLRNRVIDRISCDMKLYQVYLNVRIQRGIVNPHPVDFHTYYFMRHARFPDFTHIDALNHISLKCRTYHNNEICRFSHAVIS
jgi:hypothetical protein